MQWKIMNAIQLTKDNLLLTTSPQGVSIGKWEGYPSSYSLGGNSSGFNKTH